MAIWIVPCEITHAHGMREYKVKAETAEEALEIAKSGNAEVETEEFEAERIHFPNVDEITEA